MQPQRFIALALSIPAALAIAAGCGGDDEESTAKPASNDQETIVKADFIQAANQLCEERGDEVEAKSKQILSSAGNKSQDAIAKELVEEVVAPAFEREADELRALEPPPGDEEEVQELIDAIDEMVARTRKDLSSQRNYPYRKTENISAAYGLPACGRP